MEEDPDGGPRVPKSTDHCTYETIPATAGAGGTVEPGAVSAGAAEAPLDIAVGATLGAYTARADGLGGGTNTVDNRQMEMSGKFNPSVGVETMPMAKAVAITAGDETVVILKSDLGSVDDNITFEVAERLGSEFAGKVLYTASHSHASFGHYTSNDGLQVGFGQYLPSVHDYLIERLTALAEEALEARVPARLGVAHDPEFDLDDKVNVDRRPQNDELMGGPVDDHDLFVVRIDASEDGSPIALLFVFGMHGTILGPANMLASTEAPGAVERAVEESFDERIVVVHLQGAGGDVSPGGTGGIECGDGPCYDFARMETVGRYARDAILTTWEDAGAVATDTLAMEMVTRPIPLGPDWETFNIRDGLTYAPFGKDRLDDADGEVWDEDGNLISPIDEFDAPVGAALCGEDHDAYFPLGQMPGTEGILPYRSCIQVDVAAELFERILDLRFEPMPVCASTRTTVAALRLGDFMFVGLPGEPNTTIAEHLRALSPYDPDKTVVLGYAQDHIGYIMTVEDWLQAGYEPSINFWGPLEGEHIASYAAELMQLAATDEREDAADGAVGRHIPRPVDENLPPVDDAPMAGTVPEVVPELVYTRAGPVEDAQPAETVPRLGLAHFVWIGADPRAGTPRVTLQRETEPESGEFEDVQRRSGRPVRDQDLLLTHTPDPLKRDGDASRTHYWAVEWQAVAPWGAPALRDVEDRPGLPLGRYRFHVEGPDYTVESEPFEVVVGALEVSGSRSGNTVSATVSYHAPDGWRLLDLERASNRPVPLAAGPVTVELELEGGGTVDFEDVAVETAGEVSVDAGEDAATVTAVRVVDRFGNAGTGALP